MRYPTTSPSTRLDLPGQPGRGGDAIRPGAPATPGATAANGKSRFAAMPLAALALAMAGLLGSAQTAAAQGVVTKNPECVVPFPHEALLKAPAGFKGETVALISFTVEGAFRSARLLRSSGDRELDSAALRAATGAHCKPLGDPADPALKGTLIGIPYAFTFDNSRGSGPAQTAPVR